MEYITTATGKQFFVSHCGSLADSLYITFNGYRMTDIVNTFDNPEETRSIYYYINGSIETSFSDFTNLVNVSYSDSNVMIVLKNNNIL